MLHKNRCYEVALSSKSGLVLNCSVEGTLHNIWILITVQVFIHTLLGPTAAVLSNLVGGFIAEAQVQ